MINAIVHCLCWPSKSGQQQDAGNMSEDRGLRAKLIEYWKASSIVKLSQLEKDNLIA